MLLVEGSPVENRTRRTEESTSIRMMLNICYLHRTAALACYGPLPGKQDLHSIFQIRSRESRDAIYRALCSSLPR